VMRPLARHLGVRWIIANRLDFRGGVATGRLLSPVIRPRGLFARIREAGPDGQQSPARWVRALGLRGPKALASAIVPAVRVESPVFDALFEKYGDQLGVLLTEKIEVVEGDVSQPDVGMDPDIAARLRNELDLIINSSGLTDFNPDLRDALAVNVDSTYHLIEFIRGSDHAALLHLSTCYVAGQRDGRVSERVRPNYTPSGLVDFDAEREWYRLHDLVETAEARAESPEITEEFTKQALEKE